MKVRIVNKSNNPLPEYSTGSSAGLDLRASLEAPEQLLPGERKLIGTGLYIELPEGFEAQVRPRSGLAIKNGITVLNSPGTIDADYRGEIRVIVINHGSESFQIENGDRICQMVIAKYERADWVLTDTLEETTRGEGGFGHTGRK